MRNLVLPALVALALPAAAVAADDGPSPVDLAKSACKSEKAQMGAKTFKAVYAAGTTSGATKACVAKRDGAAAGDLKNAAKECKAQRAADPAAFASKWGTNKNDRNAYGKCVSATARGAVEQDTDARVNAARTCRKLRTEQKTAFEQTYGTKANAFGRCVSKTARGG
jgi:hypothetical protein